MSRGSGITGLAAMARMSPLPGDGAGEIKLVRPLLDIPKARLIATLQAAKIPFADDPSNRDPRFTRARLRGLMPELAREGLDARRLARAGAAAASARTAALEAAADAREPRAGAHPAGAGAASRIRRKRLCPAAGRDRAAPARPGDRHRPATKARSSLPSWRR